MCSPKLLSYKTRSTILNPLKLGDYSKYFEESSFNMTKKGDEDIET